MPIRPTTRTILLKLAHDIHLVEANLSFGLSFAAKDFVSTAVPGGSPKPSLPQSSSYG